MNVSELASKATRVGECLIMNNVPNSSGYALVCHDGKRVTAHRLSFSLTKGPIPGGKKILHTCDVKPCIEPAHLFSGTSKDNTDDMRAKGRMAMGKAAAPKKPATKLTAENVLDIRTSDKSSNELAQQFNCTLSNICYIRRNETWKEAQH